MDKNQLESPIINRNSNTIEKENYILHKHPKMLLVNTKD